MKNFQKQTPCLAKVANAQKNTPHLFQSEDEGQLVIFLSRADEERFSDAITRAAAKERNRELVCCSPDNIV